MYSFRGQVGLWLTTNMAISFPSLPFLLLSRMLYIRIPTCILLWSSLSATHVSRHGQTGLCVPLPRYNWRTESAQQYEPAFIIWLSQDCILWPSNFQQHIIQPLYSTGVSWFSLPFFSILGWKGRVDNSPFSLCTITSLDGISFLGRIPIHIIQSEPILLWLIFRRCELEKAQWVTRPVNRRCDKK